jgi:hypothetical protein
MATSNFQIIQDALGLLGVLQETEVMSSEQGMHGLRVLNELMADWEQDGIDLQYYEQVSLAEDVPVPAHALLAVKYYLAMALAPFYGRQVPPEFVSIGAEKYARLVRDSVVAQLRPVDLSHLPLGEGWGSDYDITRGS